MPSNKVTNNGTTDQSIINESTIQTDGSSFNDNGLFDAGVDDSFSFGFGNTDSSTGTGVNPDGQDLVDYNYASSDGFDLTNAQSFQSAFSDFESEILKLFPILADSVAVNHDPKINALHQYSTYTYNLTLGAQTKEEQNRTVDSQANNPRPIMSEILMSSGGKYQEKDKNFRRSEMFGEDFYIQHLKVDSIIGQNSYAQGSNSVNVEFSIYEPYGVSLIERLIALASTLGHDNYLEIPFVMRIDFAGYDDNGKIMPRIPGTTKFIPIRLTSMKFKVNGSGSVYSVTAVPYSQQALRQTIATIPTTVKVSTTNVGDFFNQPQKGGGNVPQLGLVESVNSWYKKRTISTTTEKATRTIADKIAIEVHPDIASSIIVSSNLAKVAEQNDGDTAIQDGAKVGAPVLDTNKAYHSFNEKSSIIAIINTIIKNSSFYLSQLKKGQTKPEDDKSFIDFRITTSYKLGDYDPMAKRRAFIVTYYVNPYNISGQSNNIGQQRKPDPKYIAKNYNYFFTGDNQDITNLDIEFNLAFYVHRATGMADSVNAISAKDKNRQRDQGNANPVSNDKTTDAVPFEDGQANKASMTGQGSKENIQNQKASALRDSIMTTSRGDLIVLDIDILGDPEFIKQDDILVQTTKITGNRVNGSLIMDNGELYIRLTFKIKEDPNHQTGLRLENTPIPNLPGKRDSAFTGIYRVMTLVNNFADGNFKQTLTVMRVYNQ